MYGSRDPLKPIPGLDATTVWAANRGTRTPRYKKETALPKAQSIWRGRSGQREVCFAFIMSRMMRAR